MKETRREGWNLEQSTAADHRQHERATRQGEQHRPAQAAPQEIQHLEGGPAWEQAQQQQQPHLAKAIADVGWGEIVRQLVYKAAWYGRTVVAIDKWYPSSKRCSAYGQILDHLSLSTREWTCPACAVTHDRDPNAAIHIKAAGLAVFACGEAIRPGRAKPAKARLDEAGRSSR